jgi:hypothetical protein
MSLDNLLDSWAADNRLSVAQSDAIRAAALHSADSEELDAEWLRGLLRPVTNLLDGPHALYETLSRPTLKLA